jgi:pantetheine-phosphate adenylyltransferase
MKRALFPGSFDPFTNGHLDIVERGHALFDELLVGIGENSSKSSLFSLEARVEAIQKSVMHLSSVRVITYKGLTVNACNDNGCNFILRGIRNSADWQFEHPIALMNHSMSTAIETVFLAARESNMMLSSTILREIYRNGGNISAYVPVLPISSI